MFYMMTIVFLALAGFFTFCATGGNPDFVSYAKAFESVAEFSFQVRLQGLGWLGGRVSRHEFERIFPCSRCTTATC